LKKQQLDNKILKEAFIATRIKKASENSDSRKLTNRISNEINAIIPYVDHIASAFEHMCVEEFDGNEAYAIGNKLGCEYKQIFKTGNRGDKLIAVNDIFRENMSREKYNGIILSGATVPLEKIAEPIDLEEAKDYLMSNRNAVILGKSFVEDTEASRTFLKSYLIRKGYVDEEIIRNNINVTRVGCLQEMESNDKQYAESVMFQQTDPLFDIGIGADDDESN